MSRDLSTEAKQTFQVVAFLATVLVVGIHYKSDIPDQPLASVATWNQLAQDFVFGGIARVAVPLFAFAAGLFYFRSDDGTFKTYAKKTTQRLRTVLLPYLVISAVATTAWLLVRRVEGRPLEMSGLDYFSTLLLHPPAEQLWFLRDLLVLVAIAPVIRFFCSHRKLQPVFVGVIALAWIANFQMFPIVSGWYLINIETLLFFTLGCVAVSRADWIERTGRAGMPVVIATTIVWLALIAGRIAVKADFDIWYVSNHVVFDLLLHQTSIIVGCVALFMISWRLRFKRVLSLSGASLFVYLVHEFPVRAIVERVGDRLVGHDYSCWLTTPVVIVGCFAAAYLLNRHLPTVFALLTGGRPIERKHQVTIASGSPAA